MYVLNIHNMPKIFWGAWPLIIFERPKCSKVLVPLSKLSVSKNVWFTNARLGPLDFIHSEMLKRGMGGSGPSGKQPLGSTISGAGPPLGATKGYHICMHDVDKNAPTISTETSIWYSVWTRDGGIPRYFQHKSQDGFGVLLSSRVLESQDGMGRRTAGEDCPSFLENPLHSIILGLFDEWAWRLTRQLR